MTESIAALRLSNLTRRFGSVTAVDSLSLEVRRGEFIALLGASGCGKTTVLRMVAGLERPDDGTIEISGTTVSNRRIHLPPEARRIGMVFQEHALFPHLNVCRNVGFGLNRHPDRDRRVTELLDLVGLQGLGRRMPHELSGGQQQRVALARALATQPDVMLLDEPFSNLDLNRRAQLRDEVREILRQANVAVVLVTHDQEEALSIADRVAMMEHGHIVQIAPPAVIYQQPATPSIAEFVGDAVWLPGVAGDGVVVTAIGSISAHSALTGEVVALVRPEMFHLVPADVTSGGIVVQIRDQQYFGHDQMLTVSLPDTTTIKVRVIGTESWSPGDYARLTITDPVELFTQ